MARLPARTQVSFGVRRTRIMKRIIIAAIVILIVNPCFAEKQSSINSEIASQLSDELRNYRPFIEINTKFNKLTVSLKTFHAAVHGIDKTGRISDSVSIIEGPNVNGFYLDIRHQEGIYEGAAIYPQEFQEVYWKRYFDVFQLEDSHIVLNYSFGKNTSNDVKGIILKTIKGIIKEK